MSESKEPTPGALTPNQIKGLHPAVRAEFLAQGLNDAQAKKANRLVRQPFGFKSRIAIRAVYENLSRKAVAELQKIIAAMPEGAPAQMLEEESFAVLYKSKPLAAAVKDVQDAAAAFGKKRQALKARPRPPRPARTSRPRPSGSQID